MPLVQRRSQACHLLVMALLLSLTGCGVAQPRYRVTYKLTVAGEVIQHADAAVVTGGGRRAAGYRA